MCNLFSGVIPVFWILIPYSGIFASTEWTKQTLQYKVEHPELGVREKLDLALLPQTEREGRYRRYVPEGPTDGVLPRYIHNNDKFLTGPQLNINAPPRQTKDLKLDDRPPAAPPSSITDNSASRATPPPPAASQPPTTAETNKSVILSAELYSPENVPPSLKVSDELPITKFTDDMINSTMKQNNLTSKQEDYHVYYNSTFIVDSQIGSSYWVDFDKLENAKVNEMLSKSHRRAATVKLSFDFPFYGHLVRNVTIATGGFLYTGEYVHSWLAATQYIAPLMANFDTSISNDSYIKYFDNGTAFTVQWEKVVLQDKPNTGEFTFQATLHNTGDIVFVYQNVPVIIENIQDDQHPVKVGLSDAYIIDRTIFFVRRKTIYEYHRVNFKKEDIKNWTVIYLNALPTCMEKKDCHSCVSSQIGFDCKWCGSVGRCSTGMDRKRQDWLSNECDRLELSTTTQCDQLLRETEHHPSASAAASPDTGEMSDGARLGSSSYLGAAFLIVLVAGVAVWALYAYSNPHSYSGQILIRYRPSQWSWRRGEARYTAATIHM
ncbi:plexin domain-containing protein 2 isoform X2 [Macrosteles quadrilineatus]|uniref:plexin domain-containing protein 2 isoform X2 n=1 Tax=Macrosteles quadrilineatus TaxID=74068 RepID=UPI0023E09B47|nr:plexin domain-containing protein 2 isoform X2 [Macrosteles quadrilineatus]